jgi:hypothetical protein
MSPRAMPAQRPGKSEQAVRTPPEFLASVARRFGPIRWDLAANDENHVVPNWYGPGSPNGEDTYAKQWHLHGGVLWLNSEFDQLAEATAKSKADGRQGARVVQLSPASVSTEWFARNVHGQALVLFLRPRLTFVNQTDPFPKDLAIFAWGPWVAPGFATWRWDHPTEVAAP